MGFSKTAHIIYPSPWPLLTYNEFGGYQLDITEEDLKNAPKIDQDQTLNWSDRAHEQKVYDLLSAPSLRDALWRTMPLFGRFKHRFEAA